MPEEGERRWVCVQRLGDARIPAMSRLLLFDGALNPLAPAVPGRRAASATRVARHRRRPLRRKA